MFLEFNNGFNSFALVLLLLSMVGCNIRKTYIHGPIENLPPQTNLQTPSISGVSLANNLLSISGSGLAGVQLVDLVNITNSTETPLSVLSASDGNLFAYSTASASVALTLGSIYNLVVSSATASTTVSFTYDLTTLAPNSLVVGGSQLVTYYDSTTGGNNVGIGTAQPTSLLSTLDASNQNTAYTGILHTVNSTSTTPGINKIGMDLESNGSWAGTNIGLQVNATGGQTTNVAAIFNGGPVIVNGPTPASSATPALQVTGTASLSTGTSWINSSDARLKDIQGDYEYGLNEILRLHTIRFHYKTNNPLKLPSDQPMTGVVAQEVKKIIPDAVHQDQEGFLTLNIDPIHWAVVNAVQALHRLIQDLSARQKENQTRIKSLETENTKLKNAFCAHFGEDPLCQK